MADLFYCDVYVCHVYECLYGAINKTIRRLTIFWCHNDCAAIRLNQFQHETTNQTFIKVGMEFLQDMANRTTERFEDVNDVS